MKFNTLAIAIMAAAMLLSSCEKEIEFKGEQTDSKLVINSLVEPGKPVSANISKSYFSFDTPNTTAPDDLVATLYVNGNRIGEMTPHNDTVSDYNDYYLPDMNLYRIAKVYTHDYCPAEGDVIKITASANGFDDVDGATSPLPNTTTWAIKESKISEWTSDYETWCYDDGSEDSVLYVYCELELTLEITDPNPGQTDFFRLDINNGSHYDGGDYVNYLSYFADYNDPVFGSLVAENDYFDISDLNSTPVGVFTDVLFDGRSYQIKVPFYISIRKSTDADPDFFRIVIVLEHLSKEYYNYLNTCDQGDEIIYQLYAEPIQTYTNVNGGYGIVAGRVVDTLWYELPMEER